MLKQLLLSVLGKVKTCKRDLKLVCIPRYPQLNCPWGWFHAPSQTRQAGADYEECNSKRSVGGGRAASLACSEAHGAQQNQPVSQSHRPAPGGMGIHSLAGFYLPQCSARRSRRHQSCEHVQAVSSLFSSKHEKASTPNSAQSTSGP